MQEKKFEGKCEILGHKIDLERILNPHIRRAIKERNDEFMFNYGDHTDKIVSERDNRRVHQDYSESYHDSYHDFWEKMAKAVHSDEHKYDSNRQ